MTYRLLRGDVLSFARHYRGEKFHALLCDPPYHLTSIVNRFSKTDLEDETITSERARRRADGMARFSRGFMGKAWDGGDIAFRPETWSALSRVLLPGAFMVVFSGSRSWHRVACALEDAGLIIHPTIFGWAYGSGMPKATRIKGEKIWEGHRYGGQALKPAMEPILIAQKPYVSRPIDNIVNTGAGALNIDGTRIPSTTYTINTWDDGSKPFGGGAGREYSGREHSSGRWPTNFILMDDGATKRLDEQSGGLKSGVMHAGQKRSTERGYHGDMPTATLQDTYGDYGGASRFFYRVSEKIDESDPVYYCAKVSTSERETGLDNDAKLFSYSGGANSKIKHGENKYDEGQDIGLNRIQHRKNSHPTLKPIDLTRYLATLLLPPKEYAPRRLLIPFAGVASEMIGAVLAGWDCVIGVEKELEYVEIGKARLKHWCGTFQPTLIEAVDAANSILLGREQ